jgi:hypothetical protein
MTQTKKPEKKKESSGNPFMDVRQGAFHHWLGKKPSETLTDEDIERGLKSKDAHVKKMAQFAKNARGFQHPKKAEKKAAPPKKTKKSLEEIAQNPPAYLKW